MLEILGKIGFDWQVALANLFNFVIIFLILKKFAFKPIFRIINERQQKIDQGLDDAEKAKTDLVQAEEIKKLKLDEAKSKANQIIGDAQKHGDKIISLSEIDAEKAKKEILKDGQKELDDQKKKMEKQLEKEVSEMVLSGVEKVLKENLSKTEKEKIISKSLTSFELKS